MNGKNSRLRKSRPRVIMVDDEPDLVALVDSWLSPQYDFIGVFHGQGLLELLERYGPDLIILDVNMCGPNGFALCREIRSRGRFATLPILFMTGCAEEEDFIKGWEAGGTRYLTKPISRPELLFVVGQLLEAALTGV